MKDVSDITPAQIAQLRKLTRADMSDCRSALSETGGDLDLAVLRIRERQIARLQEQSGKDLAECQQALLQTDGDMDSALNRLRAVNADDYMRQKLDGLLKSDLPAEEVLDGLLALIWRRDMGDMATVERTLAMVGLLRQHLESGGFFQYFFSIGERLLPQTIEALQLVGAHRTALFLHEASRVAQGERLDTSLDNLDDTLNEEPDALAALAVAYAREHQDQFARA